MVVVLWWFCNHFIVVVVVLVVWWFCKHFTMITIIKPKAPFPVMNEIIPPYLDCGGCGGVVRPTAPFPVLKELIQPYLDCGGCGGVVVLPTISWFPCLLQTTTNNYNDYVSSKTIRSMLGIVVCCGWKCTLQEADSVCTWSDVLRTHIVNVVVCYCLLFVHNHNKDGINCGGCG